MVLQDASGNTLFGYYHQGNEANPNNGQYSDGITSNGSAVGFAYNYANFSSYTFTLNSSAAYTFKDNTSGASFTGVITGSVAQVSFIRGNPSYPGWTDGQDFQFDELLITTAPAQSAPIFSQLTPASGAFSVPLTNAVGAQILPGSAALNSNTVVLKVDGGTVTPTITAGVGGSLNVNYQPASPFGSGILHTAQLAVTDGNNQSFTNTWSFTAGFSALPAVLPGPMVVSNNQSGLLVFSAAGDGWLGTNYGANSVRTLYARFSGAFNVLDGGGYYGGLHFFDSGAARLLVGSSWNAGNWSFDTASGGSQGSLNPVTSIIPDQWHTVVEKIVYAQGQNAAVSIWLDPDFTKTEGNQPNAPYTLTCNDTFDSILLRTGNGTTTATFSNIVIGATSTQVGFQPGASPTFQSYLPSPNAAAAAVNSLISVQALFGAYNIATNTVTMTLDGTNVTPTFVVTANSITANYQTPTPFAAASTHAVTLSLQDSSGAPYSTSWSFTVDPYPSLPVTIAGPINLVGNGEANDEIFSSQNGWIGGNYQSSSTNTLYTRFSVELVAGNGWGSFGGLEFYKNGAEHLLTGMYWNAANWSVGAGAPNADITPVTPIVAGEYHTIVIKSVYSSNAPTAEKVWLDPDFTKTEAGQTTSPLTFTTDNTFDSIKLRAGSWGTAFEYSNIVFSATSPFLAQSVMSVIHSGGSTILSWSSTGTLEEATAVTGPWTTSANQTNPQTLTTTGPAMFYRLRQ